MNILRRTKRAWQPDLPAIHEYTLDIQRITVLRDKAKDQKERDQHDRAIHVMQQVLIQLNTPPAEREVRL